ncbi:MULTISPECIES: hypothetical protein [unclassified Deinococcus]|uniref:hypothetical protein n=1 Tax=unclassified Deinococcus TaxID=2623546 RepID=UPI001C2F8C7A|nr:MULTISPECIES: hypothetical protein [unclassified Deinococcus]MDK2014370.1 hypothetical protein [Deinococcus sp. 43]
MPKVIGHFSGFASPHVRLNGNNKAVSFDTKDLLRSAVRVGKKNNLDLMKHRFHAKMEMRYKIAIILANTRQNATGFLVRSGVYEFLDPSEKSNTSYYIGLSLAHMFAERLLKIPWLMHLDVYQNQHNVVAAVDTRSRPDLFGFNSRGKWYIIEAKGRSNEMEKGLIQKAKDQTDKVISINGDNPVRIASVAHFIDNKVNVNWIDPDEFSADAVSYIVNIDQFFEQYYLLIVSAIGGIFDDHVPESNGNYYIAILDDTGLSVGLHKDIYDAYKNREFSSIPAISERLQYNLDETKSYGEDGTVLLIGDIGDQLSLPLTTVIPLEIDGEIEERQDNRRKKT